MAGASSCNNCTRFGYNSINHEHFCGAGYEGPYPRSNCPGWNWDDSEPKEDYEDDE